MEVIISMCLIFILIILIYNHFSYVVEGMTNCSLDGFKKKQPNEVEMMSKTEQEHYKCQEKLYEKEKYNPVEIERLMEETKDKMESFKSRAGRIKNRYNKQIKKLYKKFKDARKQRKVTINKLKQFVEGEAEGEDSEEEDVDPCEEDKRACGSPSDGPEPQHRNNQAKITKKIEDKGNE